MRQGTDGGPGQLGSEFRNLGQPDHHEDPATTDVRVKSPRGAAPLDGAAVSPGTAAAGIGADRAGDSGGRVEASGQEPGERRTEGREPEGNELADDRTMPPRPHQTMTPSISARAEEARRGAPPQEFPAKSAAGPSQRSGPFPWMIPWESAEPPPWRTAPA